MLRWLRFLPFAVSRPLEKSTRERLGSVLPLWPGYRLTQPANRWQLRLARHTRKEKVA